MEWNGTQLVVPQGNSWSGSSNDNPRILFHGGDILFLTNYTCSLYRCAEGGTHLLMDEMLVLWMHGMLTLKSGVPSAHAREGWHNPKLTSKQYRRTYRQNYRGGKLFFFFIILAGNSKSNGDSFFKTSHCPKIKYSIDHMSWLASLGRPWQCENTFCLHSVYSRERELLLQYVLQSKQLHWLAVIIITGAGACHYSKIESWPLCALWCVHAVLSQANVVRRCFNLLCDGGKADPRGPLALSGADRLSPRHSTAAPKSTPTPLPF